LLDAEQIPVQQLRSRIDEYINKNQIDESIICLIRAVSLQPEYLSYSQLGLLIKGKGFLTEAVVCYQQALQISPQAVGYNNLGITLYEMGRYAEAEAVLKQSLALEPDAANTLRSLAAACNAQNDLVGAARYYKMAVEINSDDVYCDFLSKLTKIFVLNCEGKGSEANREWLSLICETAYAQGVFRDNGLSGQIITSIQSLLNDKVDLRQKHILIVADLEAFGDAIQHARYITRLIDQGAHVVVSAPPMRQSIFRAIPGIGPVIRIEEHRSLGPMDYCLPLGVLGSILEVAYQPVVGAIPYLHADISKVEKWGRFFSVRYPSNMLRVGLVWGVGTRPPFDKGRAIAHVEKLWPFFEIPEIEWIGLQMGEWAALMDRFPPGRVRDMDFNSSVFQRDAMNAAAVLHHIDLCISVDTGLPHLAGAMGRPVWLLLSFLSDARWPRDCDNGDVSPLYPTTRLFRQRRLGDWDELIARVATALTDQREALLANRSTRQTYGLFHPIEYLVGTRSRPGGSVG
ncbi:MAG: glycosyltransferase family protein, partial [Magnetococcales bacterium]|nr:glycosyltransferase family protein [Magnetococcales bacterium]